MIIRSRNTAHGSTDLTELHEVVGIILYDDEIILPGQGVDLAPFFKRGRFSGRVASVWNDVHQLGSFRPIVTILKGINNTSVKC